MIKKKNNHIKQYLSISIILFVIIIDIFSKYLIIKYIPLYDTQIIFSTFNLFHIHNYGVIFSLFANEKEWQRWLLSIISCFIIYIIINMIKKLKINEKNQIIALSLIIGGATGNLIDRVYYGFVIDFIDLHVNNWHFATFNIADCSILLGIIIFYKTIIKYKNITK